MNPRFHVRGAAPGARLLLPEHSAHHAREVLRLRAGAEVRVFDGVGGEYLGVLDSVSRRGVEVRLGAAVPPRPESPLAVALALSPLKGDLMELVIQKATELGVREIRPVVTTRTDAAARPALRGSRQERWEKVASGASEQCGRSFVPEIHPTTTLRSFLDEPVSGTRLLLLEREDATSLPRLPPPEGGRLVLLSGPAGGFEESEIEACAKRGFLLARLGPRVLRAETAALAAAAIAQSLWGDMR